MFKRFKKVSQKIFNIQSLILLSAVYYLLLPFFAFIKRDKSAKKTYWSGWSLKSDTLEQLKKQY